MAAKFEGVHGIDLAESRQPSIAIASEPPSALPNGHIGRSFLGFRGYYAGAGINFGFCSSK